MTQGHSKPLSSLGIKKMPVGKTLADLGEYRGLRVTRNTAGIRYIYRFRLPHTDKLTRITLGHEHDMSLAGAMPGHSRSGVEGIYDLAECLPQIREWLPVWNDHLENRRYRRPTFTRELPSMMDISMWYVVPPHKKRGVYEQEGNLYRPGCR
ncbi:MAG: DUF4102 domain-containing protein [Gammaproteobacteria bacterium]|nr:DUF4102 domain-containing protein [Gammaproteobacteria bacterium]MBT6570034.1 DUF4102 domain-containing protein [Gammaproteobacteria bacterium]